VILQHNYPVASALEKLAYYNITSVPVVQTEGQEKFLIGFLDTLDILAWLCYVCTECDVSHPTELKPLSEKKIEELAQKTELFKNTPISKIVDFSKRNPFFVLHQETSLREAVEHYLKDVHRIALVDDSFEITGVISQWAIANYIATVPADEKDRIPIFQTKISDFPLKTSSVCCVKAKDTALNSFILMNQNLLSSIAIIDDSGRLIGNLSASDLKGFQLFEKDLSSLKVPVLQFVNNIRKIQNRPENFVVAVPPETPVLQLIQLLSKEIVHRAYIVNKDQKLLGVCSLTDVMKGIAIQDIHNTPAFVNLMSQLPPEKKAQYLSLSSLKSQ